MKLRSPSCSRSYLFIRIPLVRPDPFLDRTIGLAAPFFSPVFWIVTLIAGLAGMLLVLRQWDGFVTTFVHLFSWQGLAAIGIGLIFAKIAHELAHAYAAKHEGVAVAHHGYRTHGALPRALYRYHGRLAPHRSRQAPAQSAMRVWRPSSRSPPG